MGLGSPHMSRPRLMNDAVKEGGDRDYDCELHHWQILPVPLHPGSYYLIGMTFNDRRGIRRNGKGVRTSYLLTAPDALRNGEIAETLNTRYLLLNEGFGVIQ